MKSNMAHEGDFQPYLSDTPRVGIVTQWLDDKGYGWVEFGKKRFFAHIKDFDRGQRRPKVGEEVSFIPGIDPKGRPCAKRVTFVKVVKDEAGSRASGGFGDWIRLCLMLVLPLLALLWLPLPWWLGAGWMLVVSWVTDGLYAYDKQQAVSKGWRVSEGSLHLSEILGGWPGAFLAQRRLRHKCSKPGYQAVFWMIVLCYQIVSVDVILDQRLSRAVIGFLNR
jgi:uncharacterized membrane protein YsdA (DUF1294 family)/cold shock CspA family protein